MVDGETEARRGGDVGRIGDLLEVRLDGDGHGEEHVIQNIEADRHPRRLDESVGGEHADQADVFQRQGAALAPPRDKPADARGDDDVDGAVDQEHERDGGGVETELLDHQEAGEHGEDLAPRPGHEGQRIEKPVAPADDHPLALLGRHREAREGDPDDDGDHEGQAAAQHVHPGHVHAGHMEGQPDEGEGGQGGKGFDGNAPAEEFGRVLLVDPLQGQGLADGLIVVEPDGHEDGRRIEADHAGELPGNGNADAEDAERYQGQRLFAHQQQQENHREGEEPRHLAETLQDADLDSGEGGPLDGEVVEQRLPRIEGQRHQRRQHQQHELGRTPVFQDPLEEAHKAISRVKGVGGLYRPIGIGVYT